MRPHVMLIFVIPFMLALAGCPAPDDPPAPVDRDPTVTAPTEIGLDEATQALARSKEEATAAGDYNCCLNNPCNQCMVMMGACPCAENAMQGQPVCHECKGGWEAGDGAIRGMTSDDIKVMPRGDME